MPTGSVLLTESIQSINKLADSVENLREKLTSHPGIFFPMTKKEQLLEELLLESLGKDGQQMPTPNVSPNSVALSEQQPRCGFICNFSTYRIYAQKQRLTIHFYLT